MGGFGAAVEFAETPRPCLLQPVLAVTIPYTQRPGLRARWELVFSACAERGVAVEVNGFPRRQDLDWELARLAVGAGCDFLLASDAHATTHLEFDAYACAIAIKAGIPRERVLNAGQVEAFTAWLAER